MGLELWPSVSTMGLTDKNGYTLNRAMQKLQSSEVSSIYQSCDDLPYKIFKKCCVDAAYHLLGKGTPEQLEDLWIKLYAEFCIISEDDTVAGFVEDYTQITLLESHVFRVKTYLGLLLNGYSNDLANSIRSLGYVYPFTRTSYINDAARVLRKLNTKEVTLRALLKKVKDQTDKAQGGVKLTYAMFDEKLSWIESIFKYPINTDTLTAQMYAIKLKELRAYSERQKPKIED